MEDHKLRQLFSDFQPELTSDFRFMNRLQHSMEAVELIKAQAEQSRQKNKVAIAIAAFVGFVAGVVITLIMPFVTEWISSIHFATDTKFIGIEMEDFAIAAAWLIFGIGSIILTYNAYSLSLARFSPKQHFETTWL